ncbi:MAG: hypothetical protein Q8R30_02435 [bacterium]|nr:hypothetical protein [bacterium]
MLLVLGTVFGLTPVAYTFLRLANLIGPDDGDNAEVLGIILWIIGIVLAFVCFIEAKDMLLIMASVPK